MECILAGRRGEQGETGAIGPQGLTGPRGETGPSGQLVCLPRNNNTSPPDLPYISFTEAWTSAGHISVADFHDTDGNTYRGFYIKC